MEEESRLSNASEPLPLRPGASWRTTLRLCMAIFFVAFVVYMISPVVTSFGTSGSVFVSASLIHEGNTNLDEYPEWLAQSPGFAENIRGSYYPRFSIGASAIAAPFVLVVDRALEPLCVVIPPLRRFLLGREPKPDEKVTATSVYSTTEKIVASAMTALSAVVLFFVFLRSLSIPYALVLVFTFAFCTSAWSFLTRALWSDGPSVLMLSLTLLLVVSSEKRPFLIQFASVPLAISYVVLPANAISVILLSLYVVLRHRRYFVYYLGWGVLAVVPFAMRNIAVYHTALPQYYLVGLRISADYLAGLAGALISPGRGLFVFCPVFLLCIYGIVMRIRSKQLNMLEKMICLILILHWAMISTTGAWRGGHCFGPRSFSDMLPYLMCFLIPVVRDIQTGGTARKIVLGGVYGILATISLAIHSTGAFSYHTVYWNATPQDISVARSRLWDWRDLQFLRPYAERRKAREALR
ncbi:hypothetical protein FJY63_02590, partial [Candidatus Sumerlaeota bacterium]|nr:hypothetical protein [Candidatus Sumerlaeota bacterium]